MGSQHDRYFLKDSGSLMGTPGSVWLEYRPVVLKVPSWTSGSSTPQNLLKMHIFRPSADPLNQRRGRQGPAICVVTLPPGDFKVHSS